MDKHDKQEEGRKHISEKEKEQDSYEGETAEQNFPIVGIGSSAGGLEALKEFFAHLPSDTGMAFIIVQHQSPNHKSMLSSLLKKYSSIPIYEVEDGMRVKPDTGYTIPPNKNLSMEGGRLCLKNPAYNQQINMSIDFFFRSLACDQKNRAIGILLSGAGTDGTLGLKAIKGEGGMAMVQDFESAHYNSMPCSAAAAGLVDYVLSPDKMPGQLTAFVQYASYKKYLQPDCFTASKTADLLQEIFFLLHSKTGHDFSHYKHNTVQRRVERRMCLKQMEDLKDYLQYLKHSSKEVQALFKDLLIGVTNFFRDPNAFEALQEKVVPRLFEGKSPGDSVRVWVPGCSTGEEAYSIAILLQEYLESIKQHFMVTIFATDIDSQAIEQARTGVYLANIAADVSPERLTRYFTKDVENKAYKIKKVMRDKLIFAEHNVTQDPSFSRMDLISCRNLLIFMDSELQQKVVNQFHYSLNEEGFLFLGSSETVGQREDVFSTFDLQHRIYQRKGSVSFPPVMKWTSAALKDDLLLSGTSNKKQEIRNNSIQVITEKALLDYYNPACAVINEQGEVLYIHGRTGKYMEPAPGESNMNIFYMVREGLRIELSAAVRKVAKQKEPVRIAGLSVIEDERVIIVDLTVSPIFLGLNDKTCLIMVIFQEAFTKESDYSLEIAATKDLVWDKDERIAVLKQELERREEYFQNITQELENAYVELQSAKEEYQSTNEELKTSREELQSVNEELMTVNNELQEKIEKLTQANNDMNNMLSGTGVGTVFVDCRRRVKRFTPPATRVINLIQEDCGRPLGHITLNLKNYNRLEEDVQEVLDTLIQKDKNVETREGSWYLMRILPYRTMENAVEGAVITFTDITEQKKLLDFKRRLNVVVHDSNDAITVQDFEGKILAWNPAAEKMYGWSEEKALRMNIRDTIPEHKREETMMMIRKLAHQQLIEPFKTQRLTRDGRLIEVMITVTSLVNQDGKTYAMATTERFIGTC